MTQRAIARQLANESLERGKPLHWFETLYSQADGNTSVIPWADQIVNRNLEEWFHATRRDRVSGDALVVGCGLGDDAEFLQSLGFKTIAFDISESAIDWCKRRFQESHVEYCVADLLNLPTSWSHNFDFVLEIYTLQVLPDSMREQAVRALANCVRPQGTLLVITRGRDASDDPGQMPWPVLRSELDHFTKYGLTEMSFDDYSDREEPPVRRFRVEYRRER